MEAGTFTASLFLADLFWCILRMCGHCRRAHCKAGQRIQRLLNHARKPPTSLMYHMKDCRSCNRKPEVFPRSELPSLDLERWAWPRMVWLEQSLAAQTDAFPTTCRKVDLVLQEKKSIYKLKRFWVENQNAVCSGVIFRSSPRQSSAFFVKFIAARSQEVALAGSAFGSCSLQQLLALVQSLLASPENKILILFKVRSLDNLASQGAKTVGQTGDATICGIAALWM
ncbi:uncharacterized protein LOC115345656 [Aquila chrysaetos chrysaetos]|uniref:uncharacterized protein LOC115345656 n=1 Tax=Aquila chrysaetos chrysaetos TaxID=223781 RepID=UPI00117712C1|nr:uncharacterized protein LOC115345656 [Aquila chrysaetos chrysaetos]